jgi:hypothetical protein
VLRLLIGVTTIQEQFVNAAALGGTNPHWDCNQDPNFRIAGHSKHNDAVPKPFGIEVLFGFPALVLSTISIAWMYSASKSLLIGNPLQKNDEFLLFVF